MNNTFIDYKMKNKFSKLINYLVKSLFTRQEEKFNNTDMHADTINLNGNSITENHEVKKVKLSDFGFEQAGLNLGDEKALYNFLHSIKEGHIIEVTSKESDHLRRKLTIENIMDEKMKQITDKQLVSKNISTVLIPDKLQQIKEKENEIKKIETDRIKGRLNADFNQSRFLLYKTLTWILGFYLVLFYASAIHAAFFRNLLQDLSNYGNSENLSIILNSIFDPLALFVLKPSTLFIYLGSSLFFTIGLLAHNFFHRQKNLIRKIFIGLISFGVPFIADFLIAYKIHENIIQAKSIIGIEDNLPWFRSINFWLVIVFGFVAYMAWALLFEEYIREADKKSSDKVADVMIKNINNEIKVLKNDLRDLKLKLNEISSSIQKLQQEVDSLKKQMERIIHDPDLLLSNLHKFYEGWLRYLNGSDSLSYRKKLCDEKFNEFLKDNFYSSNN